MQASELIKKYLDEKQVMQLATVRDGQPWVCNIHFVPDGNGTLYWLSKPTRRQSLEITDDSRAALQIA